MDSGAVDVVANPKDFPGVKSIPTTESKRGGTWVCVGGRTNETLGKMDVEFRTESGRRMSTARKAGAVNKTLIGVGRLIEAGYGVVLTKHPR